MKKNSINVYNSQSAVKLGLSVGKIRETLTSVLKEEKKTGLSLNFVLVDNRQIRGLNKRFLKRNHVTDVIAFEFGNKKTLSRGDVNGEVFVCVEEALRRSKELGVPVNNEILLYCIHGLLHLIGYDDNTSKRQKEMWRKQNYYLMQVRK